MNNQPQISIILPTYNGEKYIENSIDSCLIQSFTNFELIIVNDCSTDSTKAIIEGYALLDSRIKIINNETNKKLPTSLNIGFTAAVGKYHTWTSDDNMYAKNALEELLKVLKADESIDFVYTDYNIIDNKSKVVNQRTFGDINKNFTGYLGCSACFLYKNNIHNKIGGYDSSAFLIEDYHFFVRVFLNFNVVYISRYDLYFYRDHDASLTARYSDVVNDISKIMIERLLPQIELKLPASQLQYFYRKYAIYNAVQKNNSVKYQFYLEKLSDISKKQLLITFAYVSILKGFYLVKFLFFPFNFLFATMKKRL